VKNISYISTVGVREVPPLLNPLNEMIMKYPNGYYPKIEYWTLKLNQAVASKATAEVEYCLKKLSYFASAQYVKENQVPLETNVIAGVNFSESLGMLKNL
jgi:hypothetical protein